MKRLVSILVPTKNRYKYLMHLIELIESFNDERIELLVQDNSEILAFLSGRTLVSTVYKYSSSKLSMGLNADLAIKNSTGDFLCFIGDDDAVCRNIADCAEWMMRNDVDACRTTYLTYIWNDAQDKEYSGWMLYDEFNNTYSIKDPIEELKRVLKQGVPDFRNMAKFYHGIVKRGVIDKVMNIGGTICPGPTPDMSSAVSIAFYIKKYAYVNVPVIIPGMSKMVGGGVMGKVLQLEEVNFITQTVRDNWESTFPRLWASQLIWPDCALKALDYVKHPEYREYFNKYKAFSRLVIIHKTYFKDVLKYSESKLKLILTFIFYYIKEGFKYAIKKLKERINKKYNGKYNVIKGFNHIGQAEARLHELSKNISFDKLKLE